MSKILLLKSTHKDNWITLHYFNSKGQQTNISQHIWDTCASFTPATERLVKFIPTYSPIDIISLYSAMTNHGINTPYGNVRKITNKLVLQGVLVMTAPDTWAFNDTWQRYINAGRR